MIGEIEGILEILNHAGVCFDAVHSRALRVPLDRTEVTVIALEDLIALKKQVARPRDLEDVAALESLRQGEARDEVSGNG